MTNPVEPILVSCSDPHVGYRNAFLEVHHTRATFSGFEKDYFVIKFRRRAGVIAVRDGCILMTRQYRFLINGPSWELPGGTVEDSETMEAGLRRECLEETGIELRDLRFLVEYYPGLDNVDNRTTVFVCENFEPKTVFVPNVAEVNAIEWIPQQRCLEMVFCGHILDAMTVAGLLAYAWRARDGHLG